MSALDDDRSSPSSTPGLLRRWVPSARAVRLIGNTSLRLEAYFASVK
jgi:hypothetical protein